MDKVDKFLIECSSSNSIARLLIRYANRGDLIIHFEWKEYNPGSVGSRIENFGEKLLRSSFNFGPFPTRIVLVTGTSSDARLSFLKPH